jgi:apolipoprotein N-acyltransferase
LRRFTNLFIAITGGLLLWAAWPVSPLTFLIFIAWFPMLWLADTVQSRKRFFGLTYISMFVWNVATTWWIWNASIPGSLGAFFANSLLMCFPWLGYHIIKRKWNTRFSYLSLIAFWMCFEYIHLNDWGLSWPWLTLGNAFATKTEWVQWYEYTGVSGGTVWVLLSNVLVYALFKEYKKSRRSKKYFGLMIGWLAVLALPNILFVGLAGSDHKTTALTESNIVVVQPNIDPYEKISAGTFEAQLQKLIHISEKQMDDNTALLIWPETALFMPNGIEEDKMKQNYFLGPLWDFLRKHPGVSLFTGVESYRVYEGKQTKTARPIEGASFYYDAFNGSVLLDSSGAIGYYHKSMLVPGVETLPWFLKFIDKWFEKFGGTTAGYAKQNDRTPLVDSAHLYILAPAICYESIYGEFMGRYIKSGANLICIITNDGWWKNTPGYKQHMNYARLRAIETRKNIARSANTGISCFIDENGNVYEPQPWNTTAAIKMNLPLNTYKTFYVRFGDWLYKLMTALSVLLFLIRIFLKLRKKLKDRSAEVQK